MSKNIPNSFHASKQSLSVTKMTLDNENNRSTIKNYQYDFRENIEKLEREADIQAKEIEFNECVEYVSELVDLLKHTVIIPELQSQDDWHDDIGHQIKGNKGTTGNSFVDDKVEKIAIKKGLTKEQWKRLLYINFTTGDSLEMIHVTRSHLKKVHDMTLRLLDDDEQTAVFALIDAIERHMPKNHFTDK